MLANLKAAVDAAKLVVLLDEVVAGQQQANVGLFADVALQTENSDVSILVEKPLNRRQRLRVLLFLFRKISGRIIAGKQDSKSIPASLAGKFYCDIRIDDRARVYCLNWRLKDVDSLQKKWTLLFKEDRKALIGGDHSLIRFDLSEIGIDREVERNRRRQAVFCRDAQIKL